MTLEELKSRAERAGYLAEQLAELDKCKLSRLDKIRWFDGGGNIHEDIQAVIIAAGYKLVREKMRAELNELLWVSDVDDESAAKSDVERPALPDLQGR